VEEELPVAERTVALMVNGRKLVVFPAVEKGTVFENGDDAEQRDLDTGLAT
jgi:hypothetical protein